MAYLEKITEQWECCASLIDALEISDLSVVGERSDNSATFK
jgi:hypothetical protein